jgi:hypothetical protein
LLSIKIFAVHLEIAMQVLHTHPATIVGYLEFFGLGIDLNDYCWARRRIFVLKAI